MHLVRYGMANNECKYRIVSWITVICGLYLYAETGILYASIPFMIAAYLRRGENEKVKDIMQSSTFFQYFAGIYYFFLLVVLVLASDIYSDLSGVALVLTIGFPLLAASLFSDYMQCKYNLK